MAVSALMEEVSRWARQASEPQSEAACRKGRCTAPGEQVTDESAQPRGQPGPPRGGGERVGEGGAEI